VRALVPLMAAAVDVLRHDTRMAVRTLWKHRGFTAFATLSLALGIGANTALFSLVDRLLLRSLPVSEPGRLVEVQQTISRLGIKKAVTGASPAAFDAVRAHPEIFSTIVGFEYLDRPVVTIGGANEPSQRLARVSANFFRDLGIQPAIGRVPEANDDAVAIVGDAWWRERFGASSGALGRVIAVDGQTYTIVGVAPARFRGLSIDTATDGWLVSRAPATLRMIAHVAPGVGTEQARAAAEVVFRQLAQAQPEAMRWGDDMRTTLVPAGRGLSQLREQYERPLLALSALVVVVLLITCTNVGNLLVLRHAGRRRELAVRAALGAGRARLVLMYVIESLVLALLGGALALVVASWSVSILLSTLPVPAPPDGLAFRADARVLAFGACVSMLSALLFGLLPAWRATRSDLSLVLRSGSGRGSTQRSRRAGRWLVACQVALSVLLLVGAGLFVQTLRNLTRVDVGFVPDGLLQVSIDTRGAGYGPGQVGALQRRLLDRVAAVPGVRSVTAIRNGVMQSAGTRSRVALPGRALGPDDAWNGAEVGPAFFETMAIPVLRGRAFTDADFAQGRRLVAVTEAWARRYFPGENPVGALIGDAPQYEIVGVVADSRIFDLRTDVGPTMYFMAPPDPDRFNALEVRTAGNADVVAQAVQAEIRDINPRLLIGVRTMRQEIARSVARERLVATTSTAFSLLGALLASIGIFGVAAATVAQRTTELGIRMALGADRWTVVREALRETLQVFAAGLAAGLVLAAIAVRLTATLVGDLLFGVDATDTATVAGAALVMLLVAAAACLLPARRAVSIDPLAAIRDQS
jgi:predicted permease